MEPRSIWYGAVLLFRGLSIATAIAVAVTAFVAGDVLTSRLLDLMVILTVTACALAGAFLVKFERKLSHIAFLFACTWSLIRIGIYLWIVVTRLAPALTR